MSPETYESPFFTKKGGELLLSGSAFGELLRSVLAKGVPFRFKAGGFSMSPCIKNGDVVTVIPLKNDLPRLGDIVAVVHPVSGSLVIHRVIGRKKGFVIRGDAVPEIDGIVCLKDILGKISAIERGGKSKKLGLGHGRIFVSLMVRWGVVHRVVDLARRLSGNKWSQEA